MVPVRCSELMATCVNLPTWGLNSVSHVKKIQRLPLNHLGGSTISTIM